MKIDPRFQSPYPPSLAIGSLPIEERDIGWSISLNLSSLSREAKNIAAAIVLFGVCRENGAKDLFGDWMRLAARDGAISIYSFGKALAQVRSLIGRVKSWHPIIDAEKLKSAESAFKKSFPFAEKMRHSVAHPEFYNNPDKKMGINGDFEGLGIKAEGVENLVLQEMIENFTFAATFEGVLVKYDLTAETLNSVIGITEQAFDAFSALDVHSFRRSRPMRPNS
jgi:hypothetical protein